MRESYVYGTEEQLQERLAINLARVRNRMAEAAARVGRRPEEITLVAVSKTFPVEFVKIAYNLGVTDFGENRVQEALPKIAAFHPPSLHWHMIGRLQSNKAKKVAEAFDWVESIESWHSAQTLNRHAASLGRRIPILLEVNVAGESSKGGVNPDELPEFARQVAALPQLEVQGLMTVAPLVSDAEEVRPVFRTLRQLGERLRTLLPQCPWQHLSMGMTDDYWVAIEEGATIVRIGRAIFGERPRQ
ncbi:YggS family pyridoxal phosphate-dependent enzyme [Thermogemmatispora carboxidivorans]|uniref:YggS family pyridoxal phosphate-dependent enzyme n=1 Tax=Thermogemmatispora carboxidivorans TaxID=1382306 RepID=UPI00069AD061|nr:YggS family pyridoxal phosphate-dependent enzyme [Thermogemmatispora carboxidivorans]